MSFCKVFLLYIFFSFFFNAACAQQSNGYINGFFLDYIITKDGDTIYGAVKEELFKTYILKINNDGTGAYTRYEADKLKGYRYNGYVNDY